MFMVAHFICYWITWLSCNCRCLFFISLFYSFIKTSLFNNALFRICFCNLILAFCRCCLNFFISFSILLRELIIYVTIDKVVYLPILFWFWIFFIVLYFSFFSYFITYIYSVFRIRTFYMDNLINFSNILFILVQILFIFVLKFLISVLVQILIVFLKIVDYILY